MNNTEEMAVQTFSIVPEAYQQVFVENGADFPDDLVNAIKEDPQKATQILEGDKQLKSAVVQIFKSNKETILQAAQQAQNPVSVEKNGGILPKMQSGGKHKVKNGSFSAEVKAPGDTLRQKIYPYSTIEMQTYPNGNVLYTKYTRSTTNHYWSPNSKPSFLQGLWYGRQIAPAEEVQNWEQIIRNHPEDPRNVAKHQNGGENVYSQTASAWASKSKQLSNMVDRGASLNAMEDINRANKMDTMMRTNQMMRNTVNYGMPGTSANTGSLSPTINTDVTTQNSANYLNNINAATERLNKVGGIQANIY